MTTATRPLAIVTGASSGIGFELARQFAEHGYDLIVAAEDATIHDVPARLAVPDSTITPVQVDLAGPRGVEELVEAARGDGRPIDAVAINAGIGAGGKFAETDLRKHLDLLQLNVMSAVHLAHLVVNDMIRHHHGRLLFTSSIAAAMPGPYESTYAASKAFLSSFALALRAEVKGDGITVTALMPGPTDTNFFDRAGMEDTKVGQAKKDDPAEVAREGFEAMLAGEDHVVAGSFKNKVQVAAAGVLPDTAAAAMHGQMSKPRSKE